MGNDFKLFLCVQGVILFLILATFDCIIRGPMDQVREQINQILYLKQETLKEIQEAKNTAAAVERFRDSFFEIFNKSCEEFK